MMRASLCLLSLLFSMCDAGSVPDLAADALTARLVPDGLPSVVTCIFDGVISEDYFDEDVAFQYGICRTATVNGDSKTVFLAMPTQAHEWEVGDRLTLEAERVTLAPSPGVSAAQVSAAGKAVQRQPSWQRENAGFAINRVLSHVSIAGDDLLGEDGSGRRKLAERARGRELGISDNKQTRSILHIRLKYTDAEPSTCDEVCACAHVSSSSSTHSPSVSPRSPVS